MPTPRFGNPVAYLVAVIQAAFPTALVTSDRAKMNDWAKVRPGTQFVFVQSQGSQTPSYLLQKDVRLEVQSYVHNDDRDPELFAQDIERAIWQAAFDQVVLAGGHARRPRTDVGPYHQAIIGLPATLTRYSGTYTIGYRSQRS